MVAPHDTGDLVRSLVRVPGSGSDRSAGSVCCDLSRASTLAASVPVSTTLPAALTGPRTPKPTEASTSPEDQSRAKDKLGGNVGAQSGALQTSETENKPDSGSASRKRPRTEEPDATTENGNPRAVGSAISGYTRADIEGLLANKRARIICVTPQQAAARASDILAAPSSQGTTPVFVLPLPQQVLNNSQLVVTPTTVAQLLQERNNLRQENQTLQRQLSLFQQLFRDKERLTSVVKRLGVKVL